jgi:hypothetical protein
MTPKFAIDYIDLTVDLIGLASLELATLRVQVLYSTSRYRIFN